MNIEMKPSSSFNEIVFAAPGAGMSFEVAIKKLVANHLNACSQSEAEMKHRSMRCVVEDVSARSDCRDNSR